MTFTTGKYLLSSVKHPGLIYVLTNRALKTRYRKSLLGILWSFLNPLLTTIILWIVFVQVFSGRFPLPISYGVYVLSGILFVNLIQGTIPIIGESITSTGSLVSKVSVHPLVFVYANTLSGILNFLIGLTPLFLIAFVKGFLEGLRVFLILPFLIIIFLLICTLGILTSFLFSKYYDTHNIVLLILMTTQYVTPIFYPISILNGLPRILIENNPLTILLDFYRFAILGYGSFEFNKLMIISLLTLFSFLFTCWLLRRKWPSMVSRL
jgi:ABC-2 type transport system permease protein